MRLFERIVQFGIPRSGSTVVYNIVRELRPWARVKKVHDLRGMDKRLPVICTYRNPLDVMASLFESQRLEATAENLERQIVLLNLQGIWDIFLLKEHPHALLLKYERFAGDLEWAVEQVARFLDVPLPPARRKDIVSRYDLSRIKQATDALGDFSVVDKQTGFHGNHVSRFEGGSGYYRQVFSDEQVEELKRTFDFFLRYWGYATSRD